MLTRFLHVEEIEFILWPPSVAVAFSTILLKTEQLKAAPKYPSATMVNQANRRYLGDIQVAVIVAVTHSSTKYKSQH